MFPIHTRSHPCIIKQLSAIVTLKLTWAVDCGLLIFISLSFDWDDFMEVEGNWMLRNLFFFFRGFTSEDLPPRRAFQQDETRESPLRRSDSTRPSGRSIYSMCRHYNTSYLGILILWWYCTKSNVLYISAEKGVLGDTEQKSWQHQCQSGGKWV